MSEPLQRITIIVSKGSFESIYPGLILANGARMEGIEANLFFTFFGLDAIHKTRSAHLRMATVGNPSLPIPTLLGALPGVSALATHQLEKRMHALDFPLVPEFIQLLVDSGARLYACKASMDLFGMTREDFIDDIAGIATVGQCYELASGGQILFL